MAELPVIDSLGSKIDRLIEDNKRWRAEYEKIAVVRAKLWEENRQLKIRMAELDRRITVLELSRGITNDEDRKRARARVNRLMREIDRCMALMNK